ncbi:hypothetical protein [Carboxylicivirga marina]|uniref:Porin n=1 Tax=Carboxylicivirga marina TaxID=2800988 RepID=A0ABS1HQA3_9BACT|nr:hypothetical protein [Carboxylicivirga marina]MBK3519675.1 hypothetical protein [Carboxylicivirga marina]
MNFKKTVTLGLIAAFALIFNHQSLGQDDWTPRKHITGYINTIAEYSNQDNLNKNFGVGLSEVGLLVTYQPLPELELKATGVYSHYMFHVSQLLVEVYGMYSFSDGFKLGLGRFLTPLSPINQYFYAPLNPSGVVPMLVSHHFLFPQSISGFQIAGEFELGSSSKFGYNASIGSYAYINHFESGILGIQAQEDSYPTFGYYDTELDKINNYLCGTGRAYANFNDVLTIGANLFLADAQQFAQDEFEEYQYYPSTKYTYGFDAHLHINNLKVNAEYWGGQQKTNDEIPVPQPDGQIKYEYIKNDYVGYYAEIIYDRDVVKPFARYDFIEDINVNGIGLPTSAATVGLAVRPRFETLLKLEYKRIFATEITDFENQLSQDNDYDHIQLSFVLSF